MKLRVKIFILLILALTAGWPAIGHAQNPDKNLAKTQPRGFEYSVDSLSLKFGEQTFVIDNQTLKSWQGLSRWPESSPLKSRAETLNEQLARFTGITQNLPEENYTLRHYDFRPVYDYLNTLAPRIDQAAIEPVLETAENKVINFAPGQAGQKLDVYKTAWDVMDALEANRNQADLTVNQTAPQRSLGETNSLGIKELVGHGVSNFSGSPSNRRHNISVGVEKMKGIILAPGETFSFNKFLGPVDGQHGFLPELVIKKQGTVPEFGGGLCQVSSTTFRAAMDAGLPIIERRNHAYAVQYYSPQGTDATIYPGVVDLKFTNNTPGHLLIWPYLKDKNTLVFDFYGSRDNRQIILEKPVQWDRKTDGSMKASWTIVVTKDGQTSTSTFKSVYQPPALFHKTEEFAKATTTPASAPQ